MLTRRWRYGGSWRYLSDPAAQSKRSIDTDAYRSVLFEPHLGEVASSSQIHDDAAALKAFKQQQIV